MDFSSLTQEVGSQFIHEVATEIYNKIVWDYIVYAAKMGILAGIIMAVVATCAGLLKLTTLNLTNYTGCILTRKASGPAPFIAGFILHIIASAAFGVGYLYIFHTLKISPTYLHGLLAGLAHTLLSGLLLIVLDAINPCVSQKSMPALGFAATNLGLSAFLTYALIHVVYAMTVVYMLRFLAIF